jgi:hypothetical protein
MKREDLIKEKMGAGLSATDAATVVDRQIEHDKEAIRAHAKATAQRVEICQRDLDTAQKNLEQAKQDADFAAKLIAALDAPDPAPEAEAKKGKKAK